MSRHERQADNGDTYAFSSSELHRVLGDRAVSQGDPTASAAEDRAVLAQAITDTLQRLTPRQREVVRLCFFSGKEQTSAQVGEQLGIAPSTVRTHLSHGLRTIRKAGPTIKP